MIFKNLIQMISGIEAAKKHGEYANLLMDQNLTMPDAVKQAESIMQNAANQGLPGYEKYMSDIESLVPSTIGVAKNVVDNPSQLLDAVMKSQATASSQIGKLGLADADAKLQNEVAYANFLSSVKSPIERAMEEFDINKQLSAKRETMVGSQEMWKGISGFGGVMDNVSQIAMSMKGGGGQGGFGMGKSFNFGGQGGNSGFDPSQIYNMMMQSGQQQMWSNPFKNENYG